MRKLPPGVLVYSIEGPFFFGAVENFEQALAATHTDPRALIIRLRRVPFVDITGLNALDEVTRNLVKRGGHVIFCEANERVAAKIEKARILEVTADLVSDLGSAVARSEMLLNGGQEAVQPIVPVG